ncbi:MAG: UDP-N-acetylmuramoyl-tripeptide--D-alanyl-D-alanine ligase [Paludibacteraceae bacterium]|nr:UDP-N-acetylmuramoyl-tripeptide--D-alanyl-D-alanine ligase [Paludibacteraceae bacterium]
MDWNFLIRNKESLHVTTDSRKVTSGSVFVALKGEHFDGNDFVEQAFKQGAEWVLMEDKEKYTLLPDEYKKRISLPFTGEELCSIERPVDGRRTLTGVGLLQDLARAWRRELGLPILGITGTNGKTTTKELCAAVLATKYNLYYTQGNLNNQIGVPLTLLSMTRAHEMAIVEMGASHPGDIQELVEIAEPNYGLITNVGRAHLQGFGSFEGVMRTKAELYDFLLAHHGTIFRNADNPYLRTMLGNLGNLGHLGNLVEYHTGSMPEGTHLVGGYNAENVSAALCVGEFFGVDHETALAAIRAYIPSNNRSQLMQTERNTVVVDAYNANPTSMQAAIEAFDHSTLNTQHSTAHTPKAYVLGAMRELGEYSHLEHQNIVNMLLERKADKVLLVGPEYKETTAPYPVFDDVDALCEALKKEPLNGYRILLKGSRSNQLEKVIPLL